MSEESISEIKTTGVEAHSPPGGIIPALSHLRLGRTLHGCFYLLTFLIFLILIAGNFRQFIGGFISFGLSLALAIVSWSEFVRIFRADVIEHWIASLYLLLGTIGIWFFARRGDLRIAPTWSIAWKEFKKRRLAVSALVSIFYLYSAALLCPILVPFNPIAQQDIAVTKYQPPLARITMLILKKERTPSISVPYLEDKTFTAQLSNALIKQNYELTDTRLGDKLFVDEYEILGDEVVYKQGIRTGRLKLSELNGASEQEWASSRLYILGSDKYGRDLLSRIIYGSRISLSIGFIAVFIAITLGTFIGIVAGYYGGRIDGLLMRFVDLMLSFPNLFLILIIVALVGNSIFLIVVVLGATGWMGVSRLVRGQVLSLKEQEFIQAARALGFGDWRIIIRHLLPNSLTPIIVNATLRLGNIILIEAALSFLGLGVQPPTASWGNIVNEGRDVLTSAWWISAFPGLAVVLTVVCFNLFGDGLRDALDPRLKDMR